MLSTDEKRLNLAISQIVWEAQILMQVHVLDDCTVEYIAQVLDINYSRFRKGFKRCTGMSPHQYMLRLKIDLIKRLLIHTNHSTRQMADMLHFKSASYLTYFFRKTTGVTPKDFRSKNRQLYYRAHKSLL